MNNITDLIDPMFIIKTLGLIGVVAITFAESGLFFGFFLPGDSLLFTAGLLASQGYLSIWLLLFLCFISAVLGDSVGYSFGKKTGELLFSREDSRFFKKKHLEKAKGFYNKHGKKTIVLARFIPIVRTFAPIIAGATGMDYKYFIKFNIIGAFTWTWGMLGVGYLLGNIVPGIDKYLHYIIIAIIVFSFIPIFYEYFKDKYSQKNP